MKILETNKLDSDTIEHTVQVDIDNETIAIEKMQMYIGDELTPEHMKEVEQAIKQNIGDPTVDKELVCLACNCELIQGDSVLLITPGTEDDYICPACYDNAPDNDTDDYDYDIERKVLTSADFKKNVFKKASKPL